MRKNKDTSWGGESSWYKTYLEGEDTYQSKIILPNLIRLIQPKKGQSVLEIGCGEGFFAEAIAKEGSGVIACDISPELISIAKNKKGFARYFVTPAQDLSVVKDARFDAVVAVLTLQNMDNLGKVFKEVRKVLKPKGRFIFVLNHPIIRSPKLSSWGYDESKRIQYRRLDGYLSEYTVPIEMHPGQKKKKSLTYSTHRSLQEYMKLLRSAGFCITRLEEWISHKLSQPGPRSTAENNSRKEFPLFMAIETQIFS